MNPCDLIPQTKEQWIGFAVFSLVNYFLGKTEKVKSNSVIELAENLIVLSVKKYITWRSNNGKGI